MPLIVIPVFFLLLFVFGREATMNTPVIQIVFVITSLLIGLLIGSIQKSRPYLYSFFGTIIVSLVYAAIYAPKHSLWIIGQLFLSILYGVIFLGIFLGKLIRKHTLKTK